MQRLAVSVAACALLLVSATVVSAVDRPIPAIKLALKRASSGNETLVFVAKGDPLFPIIGGANDPATGSPGGARIELFAGSPTIATFDIPPGAGVPGWTVTPGELGRYLYVNTSAPGGPSAIRKLAFKQGKYLKIKGASAGLPLLGGQGAVAIRITTGTIRNCARFTAPTKDVPGTYLAKNSTTYLLTDCSAQTLGGAICGNGVREPDEACDGGDAAACPGQCQSDCTCAPRCGDDQVNQPSEQCDGTAGGSCPGFPCRPDCLCPGCGDGLVDLPSEECDGGDDSACPGECQPNCTCLGVCGDGEVNAPGEQCDGDTASTAVLCRPAGSSGECTYCSSTGFLCSQFGCCVATDVCAYPGPHGTGACCAPPGELCASTALGCCAGPCTPEGTCPVP